ncbi:Phosphoribosylformimino-5-aminoimidazole carboxamide ribotide isomerase [Exidia glandulosa HHB12029]|uniref:1-(5-phosphoribosyl)-5-[(5-phosphoribosylamino)methylideneamino] imidazole-4-carboxamide isomerase n=1 Tax=Exidia glandulosa HHB12029 TaxID=1314781 RepID=A0A165L2U9_EXIGL|nr:Phosphoribosylformimino-5-aminoimidazole carboxamide ribotide isomerase [Exidia glandulosa HHB12029]
MSARRSRFRPCIDLHAGLVKQIVGGTLSSSADTTLKTNFVASHGAAYYAELYKTHNLEGGHVIMLGSNDANVRAAREALDAWRGGLQVGGGINEGNALEWLEAGASKVIVTSYLFPDAHFNIERLQRLSGLVGQDRLVVDVSCRKRGPGKWVVAMDKWQRLTDMEVSRESLALLAEYCSEFLIHAADVEGLCQGIDDELVSFLGTCLPVGVRCTYAGGARSVDDLELVERLSGGRVDLTFGSALDIFGGSLVKFEELVERERTIGEEQAV